MLKRSGAKLGMKSIGGSGPVSPMELFKIKYNSVFDGA